MESFILTVSCKSRRGIVAAISGHLAGLGCAITDSSQFDDIESDTFFMRVSFISEEGTDLAVIVEKFRPIAEKFGMNAQFHDNTQPMNVLIMVSRFGHCLNDLLYRWKIGVLPVNIVGIVSNHMDFHDLAVSQNIPFYHVPVTRETKPGAEARLLEIVKETGADLIVLARYMQILSDGLCEKLSGRVINIHHSFLPSFKGAHPYRQARQRGVKLIGATAHYVTADLDEGPIIEQETIRVTHAQSEDDYISIGRDVESQTLARALHAHIHRRVFLNGSRTIVFPPSPGSFASSRVG